MPNSASFPAVMAATATSVLSLSQLLRSTVFGSVSVSKRWFNQAQKKRIETQSGSV